MSDSLRDRIAAVVRKADEVSCDESCNGPECCDWYIRVADAVIAELGLQQEWMHLPADSTKEVRWVTDWTPE